MPPAANDNDDVAHPFGNPHIREALTLLSRHGLSAAARARDAAATAFFQGDREKYDRLLAICRLLDRRMAAGTAIALVDQADELRVL